MGTGAGENEEYENQTSKGAYTLQYTHTEFVLYFRPAHLILPLDSSVANKCLFDNKQICRLRKETPSQGTGPSLYQALIVSAEASLYENSWYNVMVKVKGNDDRHEYNQC